MDKHLILLDDTEFYIERNCNGDAATANLDAITILWKARRDAYSQH